MVIKQAQHNYSKYSFFCIILSVYSLHMLPKNQGLYNVNRSSVQIALFALSRLGSCDPFTTCRVFQIWTAYIGRKHSGRRDGDYNAREILLWKIFRAYQLYILLVGGGGESFSPESFHGFQESRAPAISHPPMANEKKGVGWRGRGRRCYLRNEAARTGNVLPRKSNYLIHCPRL